MSKKNEIVSLFAAFLVVGVFADETVYKTAWKEDFESTTIADLADRGFALSDTTGSNITLNTRAVSSTENSTFLYIPSGYNFTFTSPSNFAVDSDYKVEFDWFYETGYGNGSNASEYGHVRVFGEDSTSWLFSFQACADTYSANGRLYLNGDTSTYGKLPKGTRGGAPTNNSQYWCHFVITGTKGTGDDPGSVTLDVTWKDGTYLTNAVLSAKFETVSKIYGRCASKSYSATGGFDDLELSIPAIASSYTWTNASGDGLWANAANWIVNGAVPLSAPTSLDTVTIPANSMVSVTTNWVEYASIDIGEGTKFALIFNAAGDTFTIPTGFTAGQFTAVAPFSMTESDGVFTAVREAATFTWNAGSANWAAENFLVGEAIPCTTPLATDTVVFPAAAEGNTDELVVTVASLPTGALTLNRDITLTGTVKLSNVSGTGALTMQNLNFTGAATIEVPLVVKGTVNMTDGSNPKINSSLSGDGTIYCASSNQGGWQFYGDVSGFTGSYSGCSRASWSRDGTRFNNGLNGQNASWTIGYEGTQSGFKSAVFATKNATYKMGQITSSTFTMRGTGASMVEIGGKSNSASTISGEIYESTGTLKKVGETSTLAFTSGSATGTLDIEAGAVTLSGTAPATIKLSGVTAKLVTTLEIKPVSCVTGYGIAKESVTEDEVTTYTYSLKPNGMFILIR